MHNDDAGTTRGLAVTWPAWLVHAYTAAGAVLGFLAIRAAITLDFRSAFLWLFAAALVDSTDGVFARWARVHERVPNFSGAKLDDIVDYLTFVFVPAVILSQANAITGAWTIPVVTAMLLSSLFGFVSEDAKTDDHFFTGFPSYWNIVALYLVVWRLTPALNAVILLTLSALVFVRIGYVYPTRTTTARALTLTLGLLWSVLMLVLILQLPTPRRSLAWWSLFFPVYYTALSLVLHTRRSRA
jgi:phosphatidylcholine synthase